MNEGSALQKNPLKKGKVTESVVNCVYTLCLEEKDKKGEEKDVHGYQCYLV